MKKILYVVILSVNVMGGQLFAHNAAHDTDIPEIIQLPHDPQMQLSDVVSAALVRYPQRLVLESQRNEANALQTLSKSWLSGETAITLRAQTDKLGSKQGSQEFEIGYELPFWLPKQRASWAAMADAAMQESEVSQRAMLHLVAGDVREMLWKIAQQETLTTLAEHEWDLAIRLGNQLQRQMELGETAKRDVLLAQEEILRKQSEYQQAEQELNIIFNQYQALTGLDKLPSNFEETLNENALRNLKEKAEDLSWHPLIQAAQRKVQRAEADIQQARHLLSTTPSLNVGVRRERSGGDDSAQNSVGLTLRFPFGHSGQQGVRLAAAQRNLSETQAELEKIHRDTQTALKNADYTYRHAQDNLKTTELQQQIAQENRRLAQLAFQHGELSLMDFQKIQSLAFSADRVVHQRQIALKLAIARYHQALGVLPQGIVYE
ncbi:MAG: hypothetical protein RIT27_254 [Pseudomonadota bacterium]|jgi:outer membrane protein TolC